eukprot:EG_transcript_16271
MAAPPPGQGPDPECTAADESMEVAGDDTEAPARHGLEGLSQLLATTRAPWAERVDAMAEVEALLHSNPPTADEFGLLRQPLTSQLRDLRSQVVQKACSLVTAITEVPALAAATSSWFLEALLDNSAKTVGVIASSSATAMRNVCTARTDACAAAVVVRRMADKHRSIRRAATEALFALVVFQPDLQLAEAEPAAEAAETAEAAEGWGAVRRAAYESLRRTLGDPDAEVRAASRVCSTAVRRKQLPGWESFWAALEPNVRQQLEQCDADAPPGDPTAAPDGPTPAARLALAERCPSGFKRHRQPGQPPPADAPADVCLTPAKKSRSPSKPEDAGPSPNRPAPTDATAADPS